jgi:hypothetical protein
MARRGLPDLVMAGVEVVDGEGNSLFSEKNVVIPTDGHVSFPMLEPLEAAKLVLRIDTTNLSGLEHFDVGFDNIHFGQKPSG